MRTLTDISINDGFNDGVYFVHNGVTYRFKAESDESGMGLDFDETLGDFGNTLDSKTLVWGDRKTGLLCANGDYLPDSIDPTTNVCRWFIDVIDNVLNEIHLRFYPDWAIDGDTVTPVEKPQWVTPELQEVLDGMGIAFPYSESPVAPQLLDEALTALKQWLDKGNRIIENDTVKILGEGSTYGRCSDKYWLPSLACYTGEDDPMILRDWQKAEQFLAGEWEWVDISLEDVLQGETTYLGGIDSSSDDKYLQDTLRELMDELPKPEENISELIRDSRAVILELARELSELDQAPWLTDDDVIGELKGLDDWGQVINVLERLSRQLVTVD